MPESSDLMSFFSILPDPRAANTRHKLHNILVIALCAVTGGANSWEEVEIFGESKQAWFESFLDIPHGIPSHNTFSRVFRLLNPKTFQTCFQRWVHAAQDLTDGQVIAVDGKTLRGSFDHATGQSPLHLVHAWAAHNRVLLGQVATDKKSNEITAIPKLLRLLNLRGCIVTIDAMGCQKAIAEQIVTQKGDYLLQLKANHKNLLREVAQFFADAQATNFDNIDHDVFVEESRGHGRVEKRTTIATDWVDWLPGRAEWQGLAGLVMVTRRRQNANKTSEETSFYLTSRPGVDAEELGRAIRSHWGVENELHWSLDVVFREDASRVRKDHGPENLAIIRRIVLNLVKQETSVKASLKGKRRKAGWDEQYLLKILGFSHMR